MKQHFFITLFLFLLLTLLPFSVFPGEKADNADIGDIIITTSDSHLLLFAAVKNGFTREMMEGVQSGIPVTFTFTIELEQVNNNWPDKTLAEHIIQHTLSYDTLKEKYIVSFSKEKPQAITTDSAEKAEEVMAEISGIKIISRDKLISDAQYLLHIKATLAEKTLPLNMHNIIPFISLWNFETDWQTIEFKY